VEHAPETKRRSSPLLRRLAALLVGLAASLAVSALFERITTPEWLSQARGVQEEWISAVAATSPLSVGELYMAELGSALSGDTSGGALSGVGAPDGRALQSPVWALVFTGVRLWDEAGPVALIQLVLGALAFCAFNAWRSGGETVFFGDFWLTLILAPIAIVALASLLGGALWALMMAALMSLSWLTGLAATAAGATGVLGFCWLCITELSKKGAEHVITPRL
jgi:hypothetical protein